MSTATITSDCQGVAQPTDGEFSHVESVAAFLQALMQPDGVAQIFVKDVKDSGVRHYLGYYDGSHVGQLIDDAADFSGRATGIYVGMNPLSPTCLGRSPNCVTPVAEASAARTEDVSRRRWLLVDVDPVRAGVVPATDGEKHEASLLAGRIEDSLTGRGQSRLHRP